MVRCIVCDRELLKHGNMTRNCFVDDEGKVVVGEQLDICQHHLDRGTTLAIKEYRELKSREIARRRCDECLDDDE